MGLEMLKLIVINHDRNTKYTIDTRFDAFRAYY
jgi:hypothetical protein